MIIELQIWLKITVVCIGIGIFMGLLLASDNSKRREKDKDYEFTPKEDFIFTNIIVMIIWFIISVVYWGFVFIDMM